MVGGGYLGSYRNTVGTNKTPIVNQSAVNIPGPMRSTLAMGQPGRAKAQKASAGEGQGDVGLSGLLILICLIVVQVTIDISIVGHLARYDQNTQAMAYVL